MNPTGFFESGRELTDNGMTPHASNIMETVKTATPVTRFSVCLILCFFLLNNVVRSQDATTISEKVDNERGQLHATTQRLIGLIGQGEDRLTVAEVVEAVRLLRRSIRGETLSDAEKAREPLIFQLAGQQISATEYRRTLLPNRSAASVEPVQTALSATTTPAALEATVATPAETQAPAPAGIIDVRPVGKELIQTEPRQVVTTTFHVENRSPEERELIAHVQLPEEWKIITQEFPFKLAGQMGEIKFVSFFVPQAARVGRYEITYLIQDRATPSTGQLAQIWVEVLPVAKLEMKLFEYPGWVIAGEDYQVSFLVANRSNLETSILLEIDSEHGWKVSADRENFQLGVGESKIIKIVAKTDPNLRRKTTHHIKLTVHAPDLDNRKITEVSRVEVISRTTSAVERFHKLPAQLTFRGMADRDEDIEPSFQAEVSGRGTLDEEGLRHVDFRFTLPDTREKVMFGQRDEFYLSHWTDRYEVHLGDRAYSLSPLTEHYRYGRGAEVRLNTGKLSFDMYGREDRWFSLARRELAGHIDYRIAPKYNLSLNYLQKHPDRSDLLSFSSHLEPFRTVDIELEVAASRSNNKIDGAYLLWAAGNWRRVSGHLRWIHASPDYRGTYKDMDTKSAGLNFQISKRLTLQTNLREENSNLAQNPALSSAPLSRFLQSSVSSRITGNLTASAGYRVRSRKDLLPNSESDGNEKSAQFGLGYGIKGLSFSGSYDFGRKENDRRGESELRRYALSTFFRPSRGTYFSGYLHVSDEFYHPQAESESSTSMGLNSSISLKEDTVLNLSFRSRWRDKTGSSNLVDLKLRHLFFNDWQLTLRGRRMFNGNAYLGDRDSFLVELRIPFGVPTRKRKDIGELTGFLYDAESDERIPDVVVRANGSATVTGKDGSFKFSALTPGAHYLEIDQAAIGVGKVPLQKMPLEAAVESGGVTRIQIGVARSVTISGRVAAEHAENRNDTPTSKKQRNSAPSVVGKGGTDTALNDNPVSREAAKLNTHGGLSNILIEATNGSEIKRHVTDSHGYFKFGDLPPGSWRVKIYDSDLPEYHHLEKEIFQFDLNPGEKKEVLIKVIPKKRAIQMIESGGVLE